MARDHGRSDRSFPWWALGLALIGVLLAGLGLADPRYRQIFGAIGLGLTVTLRVTVMAFGASLVLGTLDRARPRRPAPMDQRGDEGLCRGDARRADAGAPVLYRLCRRPGGRR